MHVVIINKFKKKLNMMLKNSKKYNFFGKMLFFNDLKLYKKNIF